MKGARGLLLIVCLLSAAPAVAGTVYKCVGSDGGLSYGSRRVAGAKCQVISTYSATPRSTSSRAAPPIPTGTGASAKAPAVPAGIDANPPATFMAAGGGATAGKDIALPATVSTPAPLPQRSGSTRLVQGQVYSYILDGVRHYTSQAPKGVAGATAMRTIKYRFLETCFACAPDPGVNFNTLRLNTASYASEISVAARQHGVDEAVVRAIIHAESAFNPNALSRVGAQGLMQLMPATARRFGVGNPFDAGQNIDGGVQYLAFLLKRFNGNLELAAAGYNAGEGAVDKYRGVPPYSETQRYVQRVAILAQRYRGSLATAK